MKVVHALCFYDEKLGTEEELLETYYTITGWAEALQRHGADVTVIYRFHREKSFQKNGVQYHFVKDSLGTVLKMRHIPLKFLKRISKLDADVIHLHHLSLALQTFLLRRMLKRKTAIVIQHHGGNLPGKNRRMLYNFFNRAADGFFFASVDQGNEWFMKKEGFKKIMPVMEGATFFNYGTRDTPRTIQYHDRHVARKVTGINGNPVFLWVGNLVEGKDPLTVLDGFIEIFAKYTGGTLYMIYAKETFLEVVTKKINTSDSLKNRVYLIGKISHGEIEVYYNSSDYFVSGSHSEGSGYALSEALRCGCIPVVTDIPSFRTMTKNGELGALWTPGNKNSLVEAVQFVINKPVKDEANACIDFFNENLSFDAIAETAIKHYQKVTDTRKLRRGYL